MNVWRERLSRWFEPAARRCPVSPNVLTLSAVALNLTAAALLAAAQRDHRRFLLALLPLAIGGLLDAFDGIVARVQGLTSRFGDFLDHFLDRVSDAALLAGWLIGAEVRMVVALPAVALVMLNGYVGTQLEATFSVRSYDETGRGEFVLGLIVLPIVSYLVFETGVNWSWNRLQIADCLAILLSAFALLGIVQRLQLARKLARQA